MKLHVVALMVLVIAPLVTRSVGLGMDPDLTKFLKTLKLMDCIEQPMNKGPLQFCADQNPELDTQMRSRVQDYQKGGKKHRKEEPSTRG